MTTFAQGTRSASVLSLGTLANSTFIMSSAIDLGAGVPLDETFEVEATPNGTTTGNQQLIVYAQLSLDNTNFSTGPTSGSTATDEPNLYRLGALPVKSASTLQRGMFSLQGLPIARYVKIGVKNDSGVALTSGSVYRADIT
jgi:hypothetical protein